MATDYFGFLTFPLTIEEIDLGRDQYLPELEKESQRRTFDDLNNGVSAIVQAEFGDILNLDRLTMLVRRWIENEWLPKQSCFIKKTLIDVLKIEIIQTGKNSITTKYPESILALWHGSAQTGFLLSEFKVDSLSELNFLLVERFNEDLKAQYMSKITSGEALNEKETYFRFANLIATTAYMRAGKADESDFIDILKKFKEELK